MNQVIIHFVIPSPFDCAQGKLREASHLKVLAEILPCGQNDRGGALFSAVNLKIMRFILYFILSTLLLFCSEHTLGQTSSVSTISTMNTNQQVDKKIVKKLKDALKDPDKTNRNAALNIASGYADEALYKEIFKMLPKAKNEVKIDMLYWLAKEAQNPEKKKILKTIEVGIEKTGTQTLIQLLNNPDIEVKQATIHALGAIEDQPALPAITGLLKSKDEPILSSIYEVLASYPEKIEPALARASGQASDEGKIMIMELLSGRKANAYFYLVLEQTKSSNTEVRSKAYHILKDVVSERDFIVLCGMLETSEPSFIEPLQQAVASAISQLPIEKQKEMIENRILLAGDEKKYLYTPVLSSKNESEIK